MRDDVSPRTPSPPLRVPGPGTQASLPAPPRLRLSGAWPALVLLPLAIYAVVLLLLIRSLQSEDQSGRIRDAAHSIAAAVQGELEEGLDLLEGLAGSTALDRGDMEAFRTEAGRLLRLKPEWLTITLSDRERDLIDLRLSAQETLPPIADAATFQRVINGGRRAVGALRGDQVALRAAVMREGQIRGSIAAILPLSGFAGFAQSGRLPQGWLVTVTDAQFNVVARTHAGAQRLGAPAGSDFMRLATSAGFTIEHIALASGDRALTGVVPVGGGLQWNVGVSVPPDVAQAPLWPLRLALALGGVWALGTALLLGWWMLRRTNRMADAEALRLSAEAARAAENDRRKSDFLTTMSHELRTPLTGIIGFTDLLASSALNPQQRQWVEQQRRAGQALLSLVGEVLDLSRIEEGAVELETIPFDLPATLTDCLNLMRPVAEKKGLGLHAVLHPALPMQVNGDPLRLRQIVNNLLSNAIKFTRVGEVRLEAAAETLPDGRIAVVVAVADTGIGIAHDKLNRVFERFRQEKASTAREHGGSGLGLAICQRLVLAMGGTIRAESHPAQGSRFTVRIPFAACGQAARPQPVANKPLAAKAVAQPAGGLRILVAEDVVANQALLRAVLEGGGHVCDIVADGLEAVGLATRNQYDVAVLDIRMPVMDGFGAARAIRALPGAAGQLPLIALTADITAGVQTAAQEAGFNDIMPKPFNAELLLATLATHSRAARPAAPAAIIASLPGRAVNVSGDLLPHLREAVVQLMRASDAASLARLAAALARAAEAAGSDSVAITARSLQQACRNGTPAQVHSARLALLGAVNQVLPTPLAEATRPRMAVAGE
ncbi:MAG: ATP-binding protein [Alphaproteobacteria bacterium]|nr:ATP-binding protein [Alphaproteobacteria bacterium]